MQVINFPYGSEFSFEIIPQLQFSMRDCVLISPIIGRSTTAVAKDALARTPVQDLFLGQKLPLSSDMLNGWEI